MESEVIKEWMKRQWISDKYQQHCAKEWIKEELRLLGRCFDSLEKLEKGEFIYELPDTRR